MVVSHEMKGSIPSSGTVAVAELVMRQIVVLNYAGSSPVGHRNII